MEDYYTKMMKTQTNKKFNLLFVLFVFLVGNSLLFAEGTPQVSPNSGNNTALLVYPSINSGSYFNCAEDNRVKFYIADAANENLYFGFDFRAYQNSGVPARITNAYVRIRRSSDNAVVWGPTAWSTSDGSNGTIANYAQAVAGPNIGGVTSGYNPFTFDPTTNGEYWIEYYTSSDAGASSDNGVFLGGLWDITVADNSGSYTKKPGRVYSDNWGLVATDAAFTVGYTQQAEPVFYAYTNDNAIIKLDFQAGFQPIAFNLSVNSYGVSTSGGWDTTRRSVNSTTAPSLPNGFHIFITTPDAVIFPPAVAPADPTFLTPAWQGCSAPYTINYNIAQAGDVKLLLDLNGTVGYQAGTTDRLLEVFDVPAGNNTMSWDGNDGLGAAVSIGTNFNMGLTYMNGRFNIPLFDAELNKNGINAEIVSPVPSVSVRMFWDDSALTNVGTTCSSTENSNNTTGAGLNNSSVGTLAPAHAWNGNGNIGQTIPAPAVSGNDTNTLQCDDYGNVRIINTWGWGYTSAETQLANQYLGCPDLSVSKTVDNATPISGSNVTFTVTATNTTSTCTATDVVVTDVLPDGYTYVSSNPSVGTYNSGTGIWTVGNLAGSASATLQITATVLATGNHTNTAIIDGSQEDPDATNNTAMRDVTVNNAPVAVNDDYLMNEDTTITLTPLPNDTDADGDTLTVTSINGTALTPGTAQVIAVPNGTVNVSAAGVITFTPTANYNGTVSFPYTISDGNGGTASATENIIVNDVDDIPNAVNDANTVNEDSFVNGDVSTNDTPSGDGGNTFSLLATTSYGTLVFNNDGTYTYTPNPNFYGTDTFTYQLCDIDGDCDDAAVILTVNNVDDLPIANDDTATVNEDTILSSTVVANDTPSGDGGNIYNLVSGTSNGTLTLNPDGTYLYTPNANYNGTDSFTYNLCDADGDCDLATVTITVNSVDDLPIANDDAITTNEDTAVSGVTATNDTPSGDGGNVWSLVGANGGALHGTVTMQADGTYLYTPATNYNGTDTFMYQICDMDNDCEPATVTVTINSIDDVPVANEDAASVNEDAVLTSTVVLNDVMSGDGGNVFIVTDTPDHGTLTLDPLTGNYIYTPNTNFNGTDTFTYQICDADGDCDDAVVTIIVNSVDDLPIANDDTATVNEDATLSSTVVANDTPSGDGGNIYNLVSGTTNGTLTLNPDGTYLYTPNANFNGTDSFIYNLCDADGDCDLATVTITVNSVDDLPIANDDAITTNEDTAVSGVTATNDTPSGDGGNVWSLVGANGGALHGTVTMQADGTYLYTPAANYNGTDTFMYQICDADGDCDPATVTVTINSIDDVPVANEDAASVNEDAVLTSTVVLNDVMSGDGGNLFIVTDTPDHGTLTLDLVTGNYIYTPNANFNGTDTFTYQICDADGDCDDAVVTITVNSVDDLPVANDDTATVNEDATLSSTVVTNDTPSGDGGNIYNLVSGTTNGTLTLNPDGTYLYTPNANFNGTDSFIYNLCDADGDCEPAIVTITVNSVDDLPIANDDAITTNEDTAVSGVTATNDTPSGDGGNVWSLVGANGGALHGTVTMQADGTYLYTPAANYNGTDTFTYQICDLNNDCASATVTVTINPVDDFPYAVNDIAITNEDTAYPGTVVGNDIVSGDGGNVWALVGTNGGALNGSVFMLSTGFYIYTPNSNFTGTDVFMYTLCDADNDCSTASVVIYVNPVNDPPVANDDSTTTPYDTNVTFSADGNDTDIDGYIVGATVDLDPSTTAIDNTYTDASGNIWTVDTDGNVTFNPSPTFAGTATIPYTVQDNGGATSNQANLTVTVANPTCEDAIDNGMNVCAFITANPSNPFGALDCDGDGINNLTECNNFSDPIDPCSPTQVAGYIGYDTTNAVWLAADCDGDGVTNGTEYPNTDPYNPCDYNALDQNVSLTSQAWRDTDCDGDGVTNQTEVVDGTNPQDPCSFVLAHATLAPSTAWNAADCDGDGVTNGDEVADGTSPLDFCDFITDSQSVNPSTAWNDADCDNDNLTNGNEITEGTDPHNPDTDGDGVLDGTEVTDSTDPLDNCDYVLPHQTVVPNGTWNETDCDGDGITNGQEMLDGTNPQDPCSFVLAHATVAPSTAWNAADCDGDGVTNGNEVADGTNPLDFCDFITDSQSVDPSTEWSNGDCDNDGLNNGDEVGLGTDPHNPDTDGDGVLDGTEVTDGTDPLDSCSFELLHQTLTPDAAWLEGDCDGDGVTNQTEVVDGTNPQDPCSFVLANATLDPSTAWNEADCDGDGVTNGDEVADGTDPLDFCDFITDSQSVDPSTAWNDADCDNDGLNNGDEVGLGTDPHNPDTDGDGVLDGTEVTDGTDPLDSCSFELLHQTLTPDAAWLEGDCDGDGVTNQTEVVDGTNPQDPCSFVLANATLDPSTAWNEADCDGDGVTNGDEVADGTDPLDFCDFITDSQSVDPSTAWNDADCDNDGLNNGDEVGLGTDPHNPDTDGDGVLDGTEVTDGTDPLDSCSFELLHQTLTPDAAWLEGDCDGDGVTNQQEVFDGTNPQDPCSFVLAHATLAPSVAWNAADCDGDGVTNATEITDGTDPHNPCDFVTAHQTVTPNAAWIAGDCDSDGLPNGQEITLGTDPHNPDTDGDGVLDGTEVTDGTDPLDNCDYVLPHQTVVPNATWNEADCDGDGVTNGQEMLDGTNPQDPCSFVLANATVAPSTAWNAADCDGDGVTNGDEVVDGTDPLDNCDFVTASQTVEPNAAWIAGDCDSDGLVNGDEITEGTDPHNPDTDGDGVLDGTEVTDGTDPLDACDFELLHQTVTPTAAWQGGDCDGDGVTNQTEVVDGTNPQDPCSFVLANATLDPSTAWNEADCDGDGVTNSDEVADGTDPLDNCDFVTASQTVEPNAAWRAGDCDSDGLDNGDEITEGTDPHNPDTDGDGVLDGTEVTDGTDPLDACDFELLHQTVTPTAAWQGGDCDGDGVTNQQEVLDGTNPLDGCDFILANQDTTPSAAWLDSDCDTDGLTNGVEVSTTHTNPLDDDTDNDGIIDGNEVTLGTDPLDTDSDNDGILDGTEIGLTAPQGDDTDLGVFVPDADPSSTSTTNPLDADTDDDGIIDGNEDADHDGQVDPTETDPNDVDTDNDGIQDGTEIGLTTPQTPDTDITIFVADADPTTTTNPLDDDSDDDGFIDGNEDVDHDGQVDEGETDPNNPDSDNDGIQDGTEAGLTEPQGNDTNPSVFIPDADPSTTTNNLDPDTDGDGVLDGTEDDNHDGAVNGPNETDPNDICDFNVVEITVTPDPAWSNGDCDGDGVTNYEEVFVDHTDPHNFCEFTYPQNATPSAAWLTADCDGDGLSNGTEANVDTDGDGIYDVFDTDDDNDGVPTEDEVVSTVVTQDTDADGRPDHLDIDDDNDGILTQNESQGDTDGDGNVDYLDQDSDADGIPDNVESQPTVGYVTPLVNNPDTTINEADVDGDGLNDAYDANVTGYSGSAGINAVDTDGDNKDDVVDTDSDNDGVLDNTEAYDFNHDGAPDTNMVASGQDTDNDGIDNTYDATPTQGYGYPNGNLNNGAGNTNNTDGTDEPDFRDLDDDNDNIPTGDFDSEDSITEDCDNDNIPNYLDPESCDLIPNAFSPGNNDGENDTWEIPYLTQFPDFTLEIYDRWGNIVYEYKRNGDDREMIKWWDGTSTGRLNYKNGEILPTGTYFYIMNPNYADHKPQTGWIYLNR